VVRVVHVVLIPTVRVISSNPLVGGVAVFSVIQRLRVIPIPNVGRILSLIPVQILS